MLQELHARYFDQYQKNIGNLEQSLEKFWKQEQQLDFDFLKVSSSVYSSNIEGNSLNLNSFMNLDMNKKTSKDKEEIDALISAYDFAAANVLHEKNFLQLHFIASEWLVPDCNRGVYRNDKVGVFGNQGLVYLAVEPEFVSQSMKEFFDEISILLQKDLSKEDVFFFASAIHLRFVHIHPFSDGNGRVARILEKWFLTQKLSKSFWKLQSEEYYFKNKEQYYQHINLGVNFYELDYSKSIGFLGLLPQSL